MAARGVLVDKGAARYHHPNQRAGGGETRGNPAAQPTGEKYRKKLVSNLRWRTITFDPTGTDPALVVATVARCCYWYCAFVAFYNKRWCCPGSNVTTVPGCHRFRKRKKISSFSLLSRLEKNDFSQVPTKCNCWLIQFLHVTFGSLFLPVNELVDTKWKEKLWNQYIFHFVQIAS